MTYTDLPEQLTHPNTNRWVVMRCYFHADKINKIPYHPLGYRASIDKKETWSNLDSCLKAIEYCIGHIPAFALTTDYHMACIDLDHCINDIGEYSTTATKYIERFKGRAFIEKSLSGHGIHILF